MNTIILLVKRHSLITFFVLAYAISWSAWPVHAVMPSFPLPIFAFGPSLAAIIVTGLVGGRAGLKVLLKRLVQWRVGLRWYAVALFLPVVLTLIAVYLNVLLGAPAPTAAQLGRWPSIFLPFAIYLVNPLSGPFGEELGWRGYALPGLLTGRSGLAASLILGVLVTGWHLPFFLGLGIPVGDALVIIASTILFTWIFQHTNGSVLIALLFHAASDAATDFFYSVFAGADLSRLFWMYAIVWCAAAIIVIIAFGPNLTRKPITRTTPTRAAQPLASQ